MAAAAFMATASSTPAAPKPTIERGWIGGEYEMTKCGPAQPGHRKIVYVKQVYATTPAAQAGLQPGDVILAWNGQAISDLRGLRQVVDAARPGSGATLRISRDGQSLELPLTVGRETYQRWHAFSVGLQASTKFDLWPNPDFTLLPLCKFERPQKRIELRSPEVKLAKQAGGKPQAEAGVRSEEGWDAWFLLFGFNAHKRILSQEMTAPTTADRRSFRGESRVDRANSRRGNRPARIGRSRGDSAPIFRTTRRDLP